MNRKYSLKKNYEIEKLIKAKMSVGNRYYAIYYQLTDETEPKIAFSVSKRFKTAVRRNYNKRVTKEIIRKYLDKLSNVKMLVVVKESVDKLTFQEKEGQLLFLINKILRSKNEKTE